MAVLHPLEIRDGHAAGIGQDVGDDEYAALVEQLVRLRGGGTVGAFDDRAWP